MTGSNRNKLVTPGSKEAIDRMKYEIYKSNYTVKMYSLIFFKNIYKNFYYVL